MDRLLLRVKEAAELTGYPRATAYDFCARGIWPTVAVGRTIRVPYRDLLEWVEKNTRPAGGPDRADAAA